MYHGLWWKHPERIRAVTKIDTKIQRSEDEFPTFDISDEALESAEGTEALAGYTHYGCTYGYCPGY
jgi:hypothetical protein